MAADDCSVIGDSLIEDNQVKIEDRVLKYILRISSHHMSMPFSYDVSVGNASSTVARKSNASREVAPHTGPSGTFFKFAWIAVV